MANWKRVLTEADLNSGTNVISDVVGGTGMTATGGDNGSQVTLNVGEGNGISVGQDTVSVNLDGTTLAVGAHGLKVAAEGITNTELDASVISAQAGLGTLVGGDSFLVYDLSATALRQVSASQISSYISTASGGDYDLDLVNVTTNEVSELQFILDSAVEKRIRFINQDDETTITTGGGTDNGNAFESITVGLADDVKIDRTFEVNTDSISGEVFRVHAHATTATSAVFETDVTIQGNLTVNGDLTETIVDTLNVEDSTFIINSDPTPTPISTGGMIVKIDNTTSSQADVLWLNSAQLSGWTVRNLHDYPGLTGGVELSVMEFKAGAPTTEEVFGAGSFMYDTTNDHLYINLA